MDSDPKKCAEMHLDKHVVKMIIEYAQLMSTAHRLLDGVPYIDKSSGRSIKRWKLEDNRESVMMKASHINHPSAIWVRQNIENYNWLYKMWCFLCDEYTFRYNKIHAVETRMINSLCYVPNNIRLDNFYPPTPAMPDDVKINKDSLNSYRNYYIKNKSHIAIWTKREVPDWFLKG